MRFSIIGGCRLPWMRKQSGEPLKLREASDISPILQTAGVEPSGVTSAASPKTTKWPRIFCLPVKMMTLDLKSRIDQQPIR